MGSQQDLENTEIFTDLSADQLGQIYSLCKEVVYVQGEPVFLENSPSTEFYIIIAGEVKIQVDPATIRAGQETQEPKTVATLRKGQSFGEVALVDQGLRSATAVCNTMTCRLLVINRSDLMNLLNLDPQMGFKVMTNLASDLCFKIRQANMELRQALLYQPKTK